MRKFYVNFKSWSLQTVGFCYVTILSTLTEEREIVIYIGNRVEVENFVKIYFDWQSNKWEALSSNPSTTKK
jgi:hypothetical protein